MSEQALESPIMSGRQDRHLDPAQVAAFIDRAIEGDARHDGAVGKRCQRAVGDLGHPRINDRQVPTRSPTCLSDCILKAGSSCRICCLDDDTRPAGREECAVPRKRAHFLPIVLGGPSR